MGVDDWRVWGHCFETVSGQMSTSYRKKNTYFSESPTMEQRVFGVADGMDANEENRALTFNGGR